MSNPSKFDLVISTKYNWRITFKIMFFTLKYIYHKTRNFYEKMKKMTHNKIKTTPFYT